MADIITVNGGGLVASNVPDLIERWEAYIDATPATITSYTKAIKQFRGYLLNNGITQPTRENVIEFRESLKASDHKPTTIQLYIQAIKLFFKWASMEKLYPNIAERIKGAKLDRGHKKDYLTTKQANKLLKSIDRTTLGGKRDYALIFVMLTAGIRTIEAVRANVEDLRTVGDFTALYLQGKGHEEKTDYVKIVQEAEDAIRDYLKARREQGEILRDSSPLFASVAHRNTFKRLTTRSIRRIAKEHFLDIGLDSNRVTAHSLRHTTATINLLAGATVQETQQLLRHTNINTTMIYSHALERAKNNSENRIAKAILKA